MLRWMLIVACMATPWASWSAAAKPYSVTTRSDVAYGPLAAEVGDLYTPAGISAPKPAVIMIHGGGWISGSRDTVGKLGEILASTGLVVFNIDYRLARSGAPDTRWPAQLVDAQLAVRFVRAHASDFDIDPAHIGAMGDSAGGQLAVLLGSLRSVVAGDQSGLYPDQRPNVSAVVDEFGPMDIVGMGQGAIENMRLLFGTVKPAKVMLASASPIGFLTSDTAPTFIIHGKLDTVVPFAQSQALDEALQAHGIAHEFMSYDGGHGFQGTSINEVGRLQTAAFLWLARMLR